MDLQQFFEKTHNIIGLSSGYEYQSIRPRIICKDGTNLSVQGSKNHYSSPRTNAPFYSEVEVGYPSIRPPKEWAQYFDGTWQDISILGFLKNLQDGFPMVVWAYKNTSLKRAWYYFTRLFSDNATGSVYGYIPFELVEDFINRHGGIDEEKTMAKKSE